MSEDVCWGWKNKGGHIEIPPVPRRTIEELFDNSFFKLPVRKIDGYVAVRLILKDNKWVEESEADRMWRTIVEASTT